mmetsp:Transcript_31036/g.34611  ORF Transcript_31036/g.34611 Transcript_31036/m.34611 type:complete len:179 (-) Transcript_31036:95-631(-)
MAKRPFTLENSNEDEAWRNTPLILRLPLELQYLIMNAGSDSFIKWPLLCFYTASTSRFNHVLKRNGTFKRFYEKEVDGLPVVKQSIRCENGLPVECKFYYETGQICEHCFLDDKGNISGVYKLWRPDGIILKQHNYSSVGLKNAVNAISALKVETIHQRTIKTRWAGPEPNIVDLTGE